MVLSVCYKLLFVEDCVLLIQVYGIIDAVLSCYDIIVHACTDFLLQIYYKDLISQRNYLLKCIKKKPPRIITMGDGKIIKLCFYNIVYNVLNRGHGICLLWIILQIKHGVEEIILVVVQTKVILVNVVALAVGVDKVFNQIKGGLINLGK